jgi:hypothetical protein
MTKYKVPLAKRAGGGHSAAAGSRRGELAPSIDTFRRPA